MEKDIYYKTKFNYKIGYSLKLQLYSISLTLLHISKIYALNKHVNFCVNWILFTI